MPSVSRYGEAYYKKLVNSAFVMALCKKVEVEGAFSCIYHGNSVYLHQ